MIILVATFTACFSHAQLSVKDHMVTGTDVSHGHSTYGTETVATVKTNGCVALNGTKVTQYLQVNGQLKAANAQIEEMHVKGQAALDRCSVSKKSAVCGSLIATLSQFADTLSVSSDKAVFNSCTLNALHIARVANQQGAQIIELRGKTKVNGPITFEAGNGEVIADPGCEIVGDLIGGKVRKS